MFDAIQSYLPMEWRRTVEFLGAPLWWIPQWNRTILHFSLFGNEAWDAVLRWVFLLLPSALLVVGVWVTMTALYTLPFRAKRRAFVTAVFMSWWDAGRSIWFFWAGVARLLLVLVGWVWGLLRLAGRTIVQAVRVTFNSPFVLLDWTSRRYFKPGVPWIAFLLTLGWSALEATIFTYTLEPTLTEVLSNITGFDPNRAIVTPVLWLLLFFLIAGSFACVQVLAQAVQSRKIGQILQMTFVEFFVMFFEVTFLYRELIDAITPWIAQQTGGDVQLGLVSTIALAAFGWVGVRGMTWFLFGRYGTPALLAVLSRETLTETETAAVMMPPPPQPAVFKDAVDALKAETQWFKQEGKHLFELLSLPVLQLLAAAVNFPAVAVRSQPVFTLPFKSLNEVQAATPFAEPIGTTRSSRRRPVARTEPASQGGTA